MTNTTYKKSGTAYRLEVEQAGKDAYIWHLTYRRNSYAAGSTDRVGLDEMLTKGTWVMVK